MNVEPMPRGPGNVFGNGFKVVESDLTTVHGAMRCWAPERGRVWKIKNPAVINPITKAPVAFKLMPTVRIPDSLTLGRVNYTACISLLPYHDTHFWATAYRLLARSQSVIFRQVIFWKFNVNRCAINTQGGLYTCCNC